MIHLFLHAWICCLHIYICVPHVCLVSTEAGRGFVFPGTGMKDGCELLGTEPGSSSRTALLFTADPAFYPQKTFLKKRERKKGRQKTKVKQMWRKKRAKGNGDMWSYERHQKPRPGGFRLPNDNKDYASKAVKIILMLVATCSTALKETTFQAPLQWGRRGM